MTANGDTFSVCIHAMHFFFRCDKQGVTNYLIISLTSRDKDTTLKKSNLLSAWNSCVSWNNMTCNHMCIFRRQMAAAPGTTCLLRSLEGMIRSGNWRPSCQVGGPRFIDGLMQSVNQWLSLSFREIYSQVHLVNVIMDNQFRVVPEKLIYFYSTSQSHWHLL